MDLLCHTPCYCSRHRAPVSIVDVNSTSLVSVELKGQVVIIIIVIKQRILESIRFYAF